MHSSVPMNLARAAYNNKHASDQRGNLDFACTAQPYAVKRPELLNPQYHACSGQLA